MNSKELISGYPLDRELLESVALQEVCSCQYYDLADYLDSTSDQELINIMTHTYDCEMCGRSSGQEGEV